MRWLAAAIAAVLLAGCGGDDEAGNGAAGDAMTTATETIAPGATQTTTVPGTMQTSTTRGTTTSGTDPSRSRPQPGTVGAVRECLARHGYRATGGVRPPGTPNAPSFEILVAGPRGSAFIAFHRTLAQARRYEARIRRNARGAKDADVERQGTITTLWVELSDTTARIRIRDCVRQEA